MKKLTQTGFTIIELMVVVGMLGIMMTVGIPAMQNMIASGEMTDTTNDLLLSLRRARAEAISSGRDAVVCSTVDGFTCSGAAGNWTNGWLIFVDRNLDGNFVEADNELVWVKQMPGSTEITITPSPMTGFTNDFSNIVTFSYTGELKDGTAGAFHLCSGRAKGKPRREITVTVGGEAQYVRNMNTADEC